MLFSEAADGTRRYYFMDFELASINDITQKEPPKVRALRPINNAGPEQSENIPYDPFPSDMYATGMLIDRCVNRSGTLDGERVSSFYLNEFVSCL